MPRSEILDLDVLREMGVVSGDEPGSETAEIIRIFLREERPRLAQLAALADQRNGVELGRAAHNMAGSCAILGARQAHRLAIALEHAANSAAWGEVKAQLAALRDAWARLEAALAEYRGGRRA